MQFAQLKKYLLAKPEARVDYPFGDDIPVFKVSNKMFALIGFRGDEMNMNLKCDPEEAIGLCDVFSAITPGYHMNKRHWITIYFNGSVPASEVLRLVDNSYVLVVSGFAKKERVALLEQVQRGPSR